MYRTLSVLFVSVVGFAAIAQSISLTGTVSNQSGQPIAGATVKLAGKDKTATTNTAGKYSIIGTSLAAPSPILPGNEKIALKNGIVSLDLTNPSPIRIDLFNMRGELLESVINHPASAGEYRFDVPCCRNHHCCPCLDRTKRRDFPFSSIGQG